MSNDTLHLRTRHFSARVEMSRQAFTARIQRAGEGVAAIENGDRHCIEVFRNDVHVARYLLRQGVLWHETPEHHQKWLAEWERVTAQYHPLPVDSWDGDRELAGEYDAWPPRCPECGLDGMQVKFSRFRKPFWSCRLFNRRLCRGSMGFTLHPDEQREHQGWHPGNLDTTGWSARAIKSYESSAKRAHWKLLTVQSLERLGYDAYGRRLP
jgi:hypothetical protein